MTENKSKPRELFSFTRVSFETKLRMLGRFGITDVSCSHPLETVSAKQQVLEASHIQLWLVLLEAAFPKLATYAPELLHLFL